MRTIDEVKAQITQKAATDEGFRAALLADPRSVVERELEIKVPEGIEVNVLEDGASAVHLVLPPAATELDMDELQGVSGGYANW